MGMRTIYAAADGPRRPSMLDGAPMRMAEVAGVTVGSPEDKRDKD